MDGRASRHLSHDVESASVSSLDAGFARSRTLGTLVRSRSLFVRLRSLGTLGPRLRLVVLALYARRQGSSPPRRARSEGSACAWRACVAVLKRAETVSAQAGVGSTALLARLLFFERQERRAGGMAVATTFVPRGVLR